MLWYQINPDYFTQIAKKKNPQISLEQSIFKIITETLHYVKEVGFDGVRLMPFYIRGELGKKGFGSPYAVKEYRVNPKLGTEKDLLDLVKIAHDLGLKIITEFIPNHLAQDSQYIIDNPNLVYRDEKGEIFHDQNWSDTVKLNHRSVDTKKFIKNTLVNILEKYSFDGFRLDMAHYVYYDEKGNRVQDLFWKDIFEDTVLEEDETYIMAEIYDDRNKDINGYKDFIEMLSQRKYVYDKKMHDIVAHRLQENQNWNISDSVYNELKNEYIAQESNAGVDFHEHHFLRITSNHDDSPAILNFGGVEKYLLAYSIFALLPGDNILYAGDEYGITVKPSVTGENHYDDRGNLTETDQIIFSDDNTQAKIFEYIVSFNNDVKPDIKSAFYNFTVLKTYNNSGIDHDVFAFSLYSEYEKTAYLIAANFTNSEKWVKIVETYPDFKNNKIKTFENFISFLQKDELTTIDIISGKDLGQRKINEEFWIEIPSLGLTILKLE